LPWQYRGYGLVKKQNIRDTDLKRKAGMSGQEADSGILDFVFRFLQVVLEEGQVPAAGVVRHVDRLAHGVRAIEPCGKIGGFFKHEVCKPHFGNLKN
jgi:hypothetical protein